MWIPTPILLDGLKTRLGQKKCKCWSIILIDKDENEFRRAEFGAEGDNFEIKNHEGDYYENSFTGFKKSVSAKRQKHKQVSDLRNGVYRLPKQDEVALMLIARA